MTRIQACPCVAETSRDPGKTDERADPACEYCGGEGTLTIHISYCPGDSGGHWCAWLVRHPDECAYGSTWREAVDTAVAGVTRERAA